MLETQVHTPVARSAVLSNPKCKKRIVRNSAKWKNEGAKKTWSLKEKICCFSSTSLSSAPEHRLRNAPHRVLSSPRRASHTHTGVAVAGVLQSIQRASRFCSASCAWPLSPLRAHSSEATRSSPRPPAPASSQTPAHLNHVITSCQPEL